MYISPFVLGVIVGAVAEFIIFGIVIPAVVKKKRRDDKD